MYFYASRQTISRSALFKTYKDSSSRCIKSLVPVFVLKMYYQMHYKSLSMFVQMDNMS